MKNIPLDKLQGISGRTGELITEINEGIKWVDNYLHKDQTAGINYELKQYRRYLRNIKNVVAKKTVISLFGKSQVGKSYLVDSILSTKEEKDLKIPNLAKGTEHPFIGELNPPGGKESTGVVSRFSIEKNDLSRTLPIEIKLLSPKDTILILCDTYYSDIKYYAEIIKTTEIADFLMNLDSMATDSPQSFLTEDDIYDIKEYLEKYFIDKAVIPNFKDAHFWDRVAASISRIAPEKWFRVFELLWGRNPRFSDLFNLLNNELKALGFSGTIHTHFESLLIKEGSILDVQRLFELDADPYRPIEVQTSTGSKAEILRSRLAALTYEVTIPVKEELAAEKAFLKNVDILDFPGARAREMYDEKNLPTLDNNEFYNFYRRGKVAYLFNRYTENYEISSLLFCIDNEQLEVKNLPSLLNNWINFYIGKDIEERTRTLQAFSDAGNNHLANPLLIIFTKANLMLQYKPIDAEGQFDYKWETRFKSIFLNEYCKAYTWYEDWVKNQGQPEKFKNLYLLRSFNYPEYIYEGFKESGKEANISTGRQDYMNALHRSFTNYSFNKDHFYDPEKSWSEFTNLNKDGSEYIINNITPISNNEIRTTRYTNLLNDFKNQAVRTLNKHYHSEEVDGQIRMAAREGSEIHAIMNIIFGRDAYQFGNFISHFTISETEIFEFYHEELRNISLVKAPAPKRYQLIREGSPRMSSNKTFEENLEILRQDYHRDTPEETKEFFESMKIDDDNHIDLNELFYGGLNNLKNNSEVLAEGARDHWFNTCLTVENFQDFIDLGFERRLIIKLLDNLKANFNKLQLTRTIAGNIRLYVDTINRVDLAEEMIAHITSGIINEFVNSVGWTFYSNAEKQKIAEANIVNNLNLMLPEEEEIFQSLDKTAIAGSENLSVEKLIGFMDNLNENLNRIPIDIETIKNVPMIRNYRRWRELMKISFIANCEIPTYNVAANRLLGGILQKMKQFEFGIA